MNRSTDTRNFTQNYPSFLGSNVDTDNDASCDFETEDEPTHYQDAESEEACEDDYDQNDYEEHLEDEDPTSYEPDARPTVRRTRRRRQTTTRSPAGGLLMAVGVLVAIAGATMAFMPTAPAAIAKIIEPQVLVILGVALAAIASGMLRSSRLQQRLEQIESRRNEFDDELSDTLAQFAERSNPETGEAPDVQQLMLSLQRQDQKINNLTKAIKMYGKPLMEIAGQGTELAGSVAQVKTLIEGATESNRQAMNRLEQQVRSSTNSMVAALPEQISKLEASHTAMTQRLDNATEGLTKGIDQMRDGNLADLESSVREVQRELGGLATRMSQVQAAADNGGGTDDDSEADDKQADDYSTGQRKVASENVLGAIAKLKQMKG